MKKLNVNLKNCFGIEALSYEFNFSEGNVFSIYARNGLMKTSFAKTFQLIQQQGEGANLRDVIFENQGSASIVIDEQPIKKEQVFVIKSYESAYESDISSLLIKGEVKNQLQEVFQARTRLLKALEKASGLKIKKTSSGKTSYELEPSFVKDFSFTEKSILLNLDSLAKYTPEVHCGKIQYSSIFDPSVLKKITNPKFQSGLQNFISASNVIYDSFEFLEKGHLTLPKLKDLKKALEKDAFFIKNNHIVLSGEEKITDISMLDEHISTIEARIRDTPEYQEIEKMLADAKGVALKDVIEMHPEIMEFLKEEKLSTLKKSLWGSYINDNEELFNDLYNKYKELSKAIDAVQLDDTPWKRALNIFNQRFFVPFSMNVTNLKSAIIGESVPQVEFTFSDATTKKTINRDKLEELDTLSQGEKRALYLLNIIFDIEQLKTTGKEVILIIDDIADSFDYKNKYAIIEYLYELAQEANFYVIILTHNFDFHRTVSSRLGLARQNRLMAGIKDASLRLTQEYYQKHPFNSWKKNPNEKNVLALIPFLRNLIEYGVDKKKSGTSGDFSFLTSLLHEKSDSNTITFEKIEPLYKEYVGIKDFGTDITPTASVLERLYATCDGITEDDTQLENKILLAIAIRHKAEKFMISQITSYAGQLQWKERRQQEGVSGNRFLCLIQNKHNQTRELLKGYQQFGETAKLEILNEVNIMTPEHIHINSFMYEPLLDMDIVGLLRLYQRVKTL